MKRKMILLIDADAKTCAAAKTAADAGEFDIRVVRIERDLSQINELCSEDVSAIVLDYDPDVHGPAILEVLQEWFPARPVIFVSKGEGLRHPLVLPGEGMKHLVKPITPRRLIEVIESVLHEDGCRCRSCDRWGHPFNPPTRARKPKPETIAA